MIFAKIITIAFIFISFTVGVVAVAIISTNVSPFYNTIRNNITCNKDECDIKIKDDLQVTPFNITEYNKNTARVCIDMIARIEQKISSVPYSDIVHSANIFTKYNNDLLLSSVWYNKDYVFVPFRGTWSLEEWKNNFKIEQIDDDYIFKKYNLHFLFMSMYENIKIHKGFFNIFFDIFEKVKSELLKIPDISNKKICFSGHSLGAAISILTAIELKLLNFNNVCVYTFGSPRIGNEIFVKMFKQVDLNYFRIQNTEDEIINTPTSVSPNFKNAKHPFIYTHVGKTKSFTKNLSSLYYNHSLYVYSENLPS